MYPILTDVFKDLFGFNFPIPIYSFGFMVAAAILTAAWLGGKEADRLFSAGVLPAVKLPVRDKKNASGKKNRGPQLESVSPSALMGPAVLIAVIGGFGGAKLFHILENLPQFFDNPLGMIFNRGGFTFYGGLIVAAIGIAYYVKKHGIAPARFADILAPTLMLGYGIGRIGCHLAGDGDWGIVSDPAAKPSWLPMWLWAEDYPRNIYHDMTGPLPEPVYPTSLYEFGAAVALFAVLWALRKHPFKAGWLFSLYLVFAGVERFVIEKIRVNNEFDVFGMTMTQAEVISVLFIVVGVIGLVRTGKRILPETANAA